MKILIIKLLIICAVVAYLDCLRSPLFDEPCSTVVCDSVGTLLGVRIADDGQWRFSAVKAAPSKFATCIVAFEDRHFYLHRGVDPAAVCRALWQNIRGGRTVSGGSTITMQTVRLSRKRRRRTLGEKIIESVIATRLEMKYSKPEILALYASHAPFGGNIVGVEAAAWRYFGHRASQLSWAEAAVLAVLPNAPAQMHLQRNRNKLLAKRNRLLKYLFEHKYIAESDYLLALDEGLPDELQPFPCLAPHLVDKMYVSRRGQTVYTTLDNSLQQRVEGIMQRHNTEFMKGNIRNAAAVVMEIATNHVVAYCGNVNYFSQRDGNQVDCAAANRSTGSILKPFLMCAALQEGLILPSTLLPDVPLNANGYIPRNYTLQYDGAVPADEALARSLNIPMVALLQRYGVAKFYNLLKKGRIAHLPFPSQHYGLSLALGGGEANLLELVTAYSNMARTMMGAECLRARVVDGVRVFNPPCREKRVTNPNSSGGDVTAVFSRGAVYQVYEALKEVNRPEDIMWREIPSMQPIAWKTGTSFGFRDAWAVGVNGRYVVGVWVGNANGEGRPGLMGARCAAPVMFDIFNLLPVGEWAAVDDFVEAEICSKSGHLMSEFCPETRKVKILPQGLHSSVCPYHQLVSLTADGQRRVSAECATTETILKNFFVLPPSWALYYKLKHVDYTPLPPFLEGCGAEAATMQFVYPATKSIIVELPLRSDGQPGEITLEVAHQRPASRVFWHVDADYAGETIAIHKFTCSLLTGRHAITAVDEEGNTLACTIDVK
jgi:penicillin-binding protein 1C